MMSSVCELRSDGILNYRQQRGSRHAFHVQVSRRDGTERHIVHYHDALSYGSSDSLIMIDVFKLVNCISMNTHKTPAKSIQKGKKLGGSRPCVGFVLPC